MRRGEIILYKIYMKYTSGNNTPVISVMMRTMYNVYHVVDTEHISGNNTPGISDLIATMYNGYHVVDDSGS